jgi:hypothetical protein
MVSAFRSISPSQCVITWDTVTGRLYHVVSTPDISGNWLTNEVGIPGTGYPQSRTNAVVGTEYYRIHVEQEP